MISVSRLTRRKALLAGAGLTTALVARRVHSAPRWQSLWNGVDLSGWSTWVGIPHRSRTGLDLPRNESGDYTEPLGENKDPRGVYSVVTIDERKALRISGELFGALTTAASFSNYHLLVRWRWGEAQWEPRATGPRDSGILIHATGEHGMSGPSHNWMRSVECQIQEGDCGDLWSVGGVALQSPCQPFDDQGKNALRFDPKGKLYDIPVGVPSREPRVRRQMNAEKPRGQWNVTEIVTRGDGGEFKVNGRVVMRYSQAKINTNGALAPLQSGRIQLQSEGAEIYFSQIRLRQLPA